MIILYEITEIEMSLELKVVLQVSVWDLVSMEHQCLWCHQLHYPFTNVSDKPLLQESYDEKTFRADVWLVFP